MGAKQSKRSVDISGKEAEGAGEVAVAGAGGEGRVEPLADADALKPQLNGDAHIQPPEQTEKEKQLDSGTPENEKDATTEKENKEEENDKEATPVSNGDGEPKQENGDSTPIDEAKKSKKEKVKKKWSFRSISFSRKDKPKQEKKQKDEEPKTNGEPEKVPEEAAETTTETVENKIAEEASPTEENKDEKTPETPVTEPLTNGSSSPESPAPAPEQLPLNGLSLDEPKTEAIEVPKAEEVKVEEPAPVATESLPAPEIPVKTEVCEQMPLIDPTPPPLPANPPPSSVASFAATTMAPELTDASLPNTAEVARSAQPAIPDALTNTTEVPAESQINVNIVDEKLTNEIPTQLSENSEEKIDVVAKPEANNDSNVVDVPPPTETSIPEVPVQVSQEEISATPQPAPEPQPEPADVSTAPSTLLPAPEKIDTDINELIEVVRDTVVIDTEVSKTINAPRSEIEAPEASNPEEAISDNLENEIEKEIELPDTNGNSQRAEDAANYTPPDSLKTAPEVEFVKSERIEENDALTVETAPESIVNTKESPTDSDPSDIPPLPEVDSVPEDADELPPPPPTDLPEPEAAREVELDAAREAELEAAPEAARGAGDVLENGHTELENIKNKVKSAQSDERRDLLQEIPAVADKIADLIPEVPEVPELKTETAAELAPAN